MSSKELAGGSKKTNRRFEKTNGRSLTQANQDSAKMDHKPSLQAPDTGFHRWLQPNPSWPTVDGGSRRVRVTLAIRAENLAWPASVSARLSDTQH